MSHRRPTMHEYQRLLRRRFRRIAKAKRERIAGMVGLIAILVGLVISGLGAPQLIPIGLCAGGGVTLALTHHFSQRP